MRAMFGVEDSHRVIHTDGGKLIAVGSKDRKVRFIDSESGREPLFDSEPGKEPSKAPVITGHAGSVRCVYLVSDKEIVLSGSYDTSIRCWNIKTGQCLKIFRGHRDTVLTIRVYGEMMVSGSKDSSCKVWNMQTGKCQRTFRHRYPVLAVAMNSELCISGCEGGRVKVWDVKSGDLIKSLNGHMDAVNAIQFDRWHIITGSRDGYALVWSTQGDFNRCLTALKHPKEVLCLEFMYMRVITGSADGRIRVWNIMTGHCCRIMRGNSKSEPIHSIIANGDRITLNTSRNLLVLNFEAVEWDYSLDSDKMPPLVQYGSYSEAPVRLQPYPYIRAQRMRKAGASNQKILNKGVSEQLTLSGKPPMSQIAYRAPQIPHSAKSLSAKSLSSAHMIQTITATESGFQIPNHLNLRGERSLPHMDIVTDRHFSRDASASLRKYMSIKSPVPKSGKSRPTTGKSGISQPSVTILNEVNERELEEWREPVVIHRRVSWAFEKPLVSQLRDISLSETKALLRSQMRMRAESIIPPDFIYLTVNAIQNSMKPSETTNNTEQNIKDAKTVKIDTRGKRPQSSPSKIDPRNRIPSEEVDIYQLQGKVEIADTLSEVSEARSYKSAKMKVSHSETVDKEVYATKCEVKMLKTAPRTSLQPKRIRTTLPMGRIIRPISASVVRKVPSEEESQTGRPVTAPMARARPGTAASSIPSNIATSLPGATPMRKKAQCISITGVEANFVPMLMYPPDMKEKLASMLKERREMRADDLLESASEIGLGKVSPFNDPLRSHARFELRTYEQEKEHIANIQKQYETDKDKEEAILEKRKKMLWTAKAKGISKTRSAPIS
ncbi:hypothetical protein ACJMK2_034367 [Sinanodonta woodiana]|uniref:Uncharacterized protein n=1 Tax=Sinanodonta woodiana TaxID=1069815 RepID=A0ABD3WSS5_SINWO